MREVDLQHFLDAQEPLYEQVLVELEQGRKTSHWMWFIFPQVAGLGRSPMAEKYEIKSLDEAKCYLAHPVLGTRLRECAELLLQHQNHKIVEIMGSPDDMKLKSSVTLFDAIAQSQNVPDNVFKRVREMFFGNHACPHTLKFISDSGKA